MASQDQLIQTIRFALATLSERNGQHEFEHVCRHFARSRICFHILPSTGPVSGGGDQGRDFETFRTFIHTLGNQAFSAVAEGKKIAFACSLEKKVVGKIKSDVAKILQGGIRPDLVYFFSGEPVSVSKRHALQDWAMQQYSVELEILDCIALAEQLAAPEVFWIAARYLQVSPEIYPRPSDGDSEYERLALKWMTAQRNAKRFADFIEIKRAARMALILARHDLPHWIALLADYEAHCEGDVERRQVEYELLALTMRERRSLRGDEARIRNFFRNSGLLTYPDIATQAETIHTYVSTAQSMGEADILPEELTTWRAAITEAVEVGIETPGSDNQLCLWLQLRGSIELHTQLWSGSIDFAKCVAPWNRLTECLPHAPTFPVQEFHDLIIKFSEQFEDPPILDDLIERIRPFLAERAGSYALAESHFRRAQRFFETDQTSRAVRELHNARLKWFSHETMDEAANCCLLLAQCYKQLGLHSASIYYALIASFICANTVDASLHEHVHEGLYLAAEAAYAIGHWSFFFELAGTAINVQHHTTPAGLNVEKSPPLKQLLQNLAPALGVTHRLTPTIFEATMKEFRSRGMEEFLLVGIDAFQDITEHWTVSDFETALRENHTGPPHSDAGGRCEAMWAALGVRWRLRWPNDYTALRVALEVAAFLQIAISELAGCDLDIIPGTMLADIELTDSDMLTAEPVSDNSVCRWRIFVPRAPLRGTEGVEAFRSRMLECFVDMIGSLSAMSDDRFIEVFRQEVAPNLFAHDFFARRLPELLDSFSCRERFGTLGRNDCAAPLDPEIWHPRTEESLAWVGTIHPKFSEQTSLQQIRRRYDVSLPALRHTLPRVIRDDTFKATIAALRMEGWKDWHIVMAMVNVVANYRIDLRGGAGENEELYAEMMKAEIFLPENCDSSPVPASQFTRDRLRVYLLMALNAGLSAEGLQFRHRTPNSNNVFEYAKARWRYFDLDVEHPDVFAY